MVLPSLFFFRFFAAGVETDTTALIQHTINYSHILHRLPKFGPTALSAAPSSSSEVLRLFRELEADSSVVGAVDAGCITVLDSIRSLALDAST